MTSACVSPATYDAAVVDNSLNSNYTYPSFGSKSFRISNAVTSGCFGDQTFAKPLNDAVGEADATDGTFSPGNRQTHYEMQFDIASAVPTAQQPGLFISVSPDRGDGSRMSYLGFEDGTSGINVYFYDVQGTSNPANFVETQVASGLDRTIKHTIKLTMDTIDGESNDVVNVYIDGTLVHTGTSWENYYRYDSEAAAEQSPRIVKTILFRAGGTAAPSTAGNGFLFDNISFSSSTLLTNGSFETGPGGSYAYIPGGSTDLTGWTTTQHGVEWFDPNAQYGWGPAEDGTYAVDLAPTTFTGGGIEQSFSTVPGQYYQVRFYATTLEAYGRDGTGEVDLFVDGNQISSYALTNPSPTVAWQLYTAVFQATGPTTKIEFQNNQDPYLHFAMIDAVSVASSAPPSINLVVSALTATPTPAAVGQTVTWTATVTNNGTTPANEFEVDFYKNLTTKPVAGQTGDTSCNIGNLPPGASTMCTGQVSYSATGSYTEWAQADTLNTVAETSESDNTNHNSVSIRQPDLRMMSLTVSPSPVAVGDPVTIEATVENVGTVDVIGAFSIDLYKNLSSAPTIGQVGDAACNQSGLAAGATYICTGTVTYTGGGTFNVWALADSQGTVQETNETDNTKGPVSVTVALPDLAITGLSLPTGGLTTDNPVTVTATITNNGAAPASGFVVDFYKDLSSAPSTSQAGDANCPISGLAAGASTTCSVDLSYPVGTFQLWAQADRLNAVTESNEGNNTAGPVSLSVTTSADLVIDSFTVSSTYYTAIGQDVTLTAMVRNAGNSPANAFEVDLYKNLSSSPGVNPGDITCNIATLDPGNTATCSGTVSYDATGYYNTWAQVDTQNSVSETNESNNVAGPTRVAVRETDLRITSLTVSSSTVTIGEPVTITATVFNSGVVDAPAFSVDLYKNLTTTPILGQVGDYTCNLPSLASGATTTCSTTVTYSSTGKYDVRAQADTQNNVPETNEGNNLKGPVYVTVAQPDLVVSSLRTAPTSASVGDAVSLIAYVKNVGGYTAGNSFTVDLYKDSATAPAPGQPGDVTCTIASLDAGSTATCSGDVTYDAPGTYQVWVQVDTGNADVESDETNNIGGPVFITIH